MFTENNMSAPLWKVIPPLTSLSVPSSLIPQSKKRPALTMGSVISSKNHCHNEIPWTPRSCVCLAQPIRCRPNPKSGPQSNPKERVAAWNMELSNTDSQICRQREGNVSPLTKVTFWLHQQRMLYPWKKLRKHPSLSPCFFQLNWHITITHWNNAKFFLQGQVSEMAGFTNECLDHSEGH